MDALELDVALTADGVVVVTHDPALNPDITRGPAGGWLTAPGPSIRALPRAALQSYDVGRIRPGTAYARAFPAQAGFDGARIPTLAEALAIDCTVRFDIEIKTFPHDPTATASPAEIADAVAAALDAAGAARRAVVQSFDWRGLRHLRATRPDLSLAWLTRAAAEGETRLWWDGPDRSDFAGSTARAVAAEGGPIWAPEHRSLTAASVAEAQTLGLRVVAWTVNRQNDLLRLMRLGVDGLISDRPDIARRVMAGAGLPLPPARIAQRVSPPLTPS